MQLKAKPLLFSQKLPKLTDNENFGTVTTLDDSRTGNSLSRDRNA